MQVLEWGNTNTKIAKAVGEDMFTECISNTESSNNRIINLAKN